MKLLSGLVASATALRNDFDWSTVSMPRGGAVQTILKTNEFEFEGNHWTGFSNNYGGCDVHLKDHPDEKSDATPKNRFQPLAPDEECFAAKCMAPLKSNRRYKVQ